MTKKTKERASSDVGFIFIAYNLKRIMNIVGISILIRLIITFSFKNVLNQLKIIGNRIIRTLNKQKIIFNKINIILLFYKICIIIE